MKSSMKISIILLMLMFIQLGAVNFTLANSVRIEMNDSLQPLVKFSSYSENIPAGRISLPGKEMIRKADNEMHRNMKNDLIGIQVTNKIDNKINTSDKEITKNFFLTYQIAISYNTTLADEFMTNTFQAEHINTRYLNSALYADYQMNKMFYSSK